MKNVIKGIVAVAIGLPAAIIGMNVAGKLVEKYSNKNEEGEE